MLEWVTQILPDDVPGLIWQGFVALLAAWLAVRMAMHRFVSERWWERQEEAYTRIVETLSELLFWLAELEEDVIGSESFSDERRKEIYSGVSKSKQVIARASREGSFRVTRAAAEALRVLNKALDRRGNHPMDDISIWWKATDECLSVVNREAKQALGLERSWCRRRF